jgi:hypothetical protein
MTDLFPRGLPQGNKSVGGSKGDAPLAGGRGFMPRPRRGVLKSKMTLAMGIVGLYRYCDNFLLTCDKRLGRSEEDPNRGKISSMLG